MSEVIKIIFFPLTKGRARPPLCRVLQGKGQVVAGRDAFAPHLARMSDTSTDDVRKSEIHLQLLLLFSRCQECIS